MFKSLKNKLRDAEQVERNYEKMERSFGKVDLYISSKEAGQLNSLKASDLLDK
ncbi:hypothetical protein FACS189465_0920 [Clostridia bacterium]|nr:hypothetical protein FACS189465_0920 [Clostridia bacterium]